MKYNEAEARKLSVNRKKRRARLKKKSIIRDLLTIIHSYFPFLITDLRNVKDPRYTNYTDYDISILLIERIMSAIFSIESMRSQTFEFNDENMIKNIAIILKKNLEELPHHGTINDCFEKLKPSELEGIIKKMILALIRRNTFKNSRVRGKYWQILIDGTTLTSFPHKHCNKCLYRRYKNKKGEVTSVEFYHYVLEAKLVLHENLVFSICSIFVDNEDGIPDEKELYSKEYDEPSYEKKKQNCELNAFQDLAAKLKGMFPKLPICITADALYPCKKVFEICRKNGWRYILRFKEGCIPTLYESYEATHTAKYKQQSFRKIVDEKKQEYFYAAGFTYEDYNINFVECKETELNPSEADKNKEEAKPFLFITDLAVARMNCESTVMFGRRRWKIENEGFKVQKRNGYYLKHMFSKNYNAMKIHYYLIQIAHAISQLLENSTDLMEAARLSLKQFHKNLLDTFKSNLLTTDDILIAEVPQRIVLKY